MGGDERRRDRDSDRRDRSAGHSDRDRSERSRDRDRERDRDRDVRDRYRGSGGNLSSGGGSRRDRDRAQGHENAERRSSHDSQKDLRRSVDSRENLKEAVKKIPSSGSLPTTSSSSNRLISELRTAALASLKRATPVTVDKVVQETKKRKYSPITWEGDTPDKPETKQLETKQLGDEDKAQREGSARKLRETSEEGEAGEITSEDDHHAALPLPPPPPTIPKESPASLVGSGAGRETAHAALRTETNGHGATSVSPESEEHIEDGPVDELDVAQAKARWGVPVPGEVDSDEEIEDEFDRLNQPPKPSTSTASRPAWAQALEEEDEIEKRRLARALDDAAYERELNRKELEEMEEEGVESGPGEDEVDEEKVVNVRALNMLNCCRSVDEFERLNRIDEGAYGVVYRARDRESNEVLALKKVKMDKEREGFPLTSIREINILLSMDHPNIVDVKEVAVGRDLDAVFMVMEFMEHDLKGLVDEMKQPFSQAEVKTLMMQLFEGTAYMHDNWVLHRDLKTSNILYNNKGDLKICDLGLARQYGSPLRPYTHMVVTLWYRAPELLLGCKLYSTAIDMWSLGCIMAELLQKEPLLPGKTELEQLDKMFKLLGTPNEKIWPGFNKLPTVKKVKFAEQKFNNLRNKFPPVNTAGGPALSDEGFDLLNKLLTYDPEKRISAQDALDHPWFDEHPRPKAKELMPTYPTRKDGTKARDRRKFKSPDPLEELKRTEELQKKMDSGTGGLFSFASQPKTEALKLSFGR